MCNILIFTGKGGVGKSSIAAAAAVRFAAEGRETVLVSTDMAHNIGDIFERNIGSREMQLMPHLSALELDPDSLIREEFPQAAQTIRDLTGLSGFDNVDFEQHAYLPGFENLFSLLKIESLYLSGKYDKIIVDCAPTAETLSLLKLPELLSWYLEKFFPVGRTLVRVLSPMAKHRYQVTLPDRKAMDEIERILAHLIRLQIMLKDADICRVRIVCIPEKMVLEETKRTYMYLKLYGYHVDGLFINRVLPDEADNPFMAGWKKIQEIYLEAYGQVFADICQARLPWFPRDIRGVEGIAGLSSCLPEESAFRPAQDDQEVWEMDGEAVRLSVLLPGAEEADVSIRKSELDLFITVNDFRRCIPLPNTLRHYHIEDTWLKDDKLYVSFRKIVS